MNNNRKTNEIALRIGANVFEKHQSKGVVFIVIALLALSGCKSLGEVAQSKKYVEPKGVTVMSEAEIREKVIGSTIAGKSNRGPMYVEYYQLDGSTKGLWDGEPYTSTWAIAGKVWCWQGSSSQGCNLIALNDDEITWYDLKGVEKSRAKLMPGNAKGL